MGSSLFSFSFSLPLLLLLPEKVVLAGRRKDALLVPDIVAARKVFLLTQSRKVRDCVA